LDDVVVSISAKPMLLCGLDEEGEVLDMLVPKRCNKQAVGRQVLLTNFFIYYSDSIGLAMPDPTSESLDRIHNKIAQAAPAGVWLRADSLDIGTPNAVEKALQRLPLRGDIRRPCRGLYDKPGISELTGKKVFAPRASFIDAIARRDKLRMLIHGMTAANVLGLTTAVPTRSTI
jgi:hypothetical protein